MNIVRKNALISSLVLLMTTTAWCMEVQKIMALVQGWKDKKETVIEYEQKAKETNEPQNYTEGEKLLATFSPDGFVKLFSEVHDDSMPVEFLLQCIDGMNQQNQKKEEPQDDDKIPLIRRHEEGPSKKICNLY